MSDPLGRPLEAPFGLGDGSRGAGVVETAAASGLGLVEPGERDPIAASTFGTGELIVAAIEAGAERRLSRASAGAPPPMEAPARIRAIREAGGLGDARIVVLSDVRTPFEHAARVFAPAEGGGRGRGRVA